MLRHIVSHYIAVFSLNSFTLHNLCTAYYITVLQRAVSGRSRFRHNTDSVRNDHHWLPVKQRIQFKGVDVCLQIPARLQSGLYKNLICHFALATSRSSLRSSLRYRNKFAERTFAVADNFIWNNLPDHIHLASSLTIFHKLLKFIGSVIIVFL